MPIIFGTSSKDPDIWKCDYLNFDPEAACNTQEMISLQNIPRGWYENEIGEVFCLEHNPEEREICLE